MGGYSHEREHLVFVKERRKKDKKTDVWHVRNGESQFLAYVMYRPGWRRYVMRFIPRDEAVDFDAKCLEQARDFVDLETKKLKATWKKRKGV